MNLNASLDEINFNAKQLALNLLNQNQFVEAEFVLDKVFTLNEHDLDFLHICRIVKYKLNKIEEVVLIFDKIIKLDESAENYNDKGLCLASIGRYDEAIQNLKIAIDKNPNCSVLWSNLGLQYKKINNLEIAIFCLIESTKHNPSEFEWSFLGSLYVQNKNMNKAEECFLKAIELNLEFAQAHLGLSQIYFEKGEWEKAWPHYEWRYKTFDQLKFWSNLLEAPKKWNGECLQGKTILLHGEQGNGDCIQFFRYVPYLKAQKIIMYCDQGFSGIFQNYVDEIFYKDPSLVSQKDLPQHDYHCSLSSLPFCLKLNEIPLFNIKIKTNKDLRLYGDYYKIGIVWAGNPQHPNDAARSCGLEFFERLATISGMKLFNLTKDFNCSKERLENLGIVDFSNNLTTYESTASIINSLDLVLTVDTSVLHLAGSMNKKTWALMPWDCDLRWGLSSDSTIWYPSVRIFRQQEKNNWESVFQIVENELLKLLIK